MTGLRLLGIVAFSFLVQLAIHHVPATQQLFQIGALSILDRAITVIVGTMPLVVLEFAKVIRTTLRHA